MLPTFFYSLTFFRDNMSDALEHVVVEGLDAVGYDLVELRKGGSRSRPVLEVRIDRRDGEKVTVDDCARASRALEARLDSGSFVAERYVLQVSSPGERPLRTPAEWRRFVGRWANVLAPEFGGRFEAEIAEVEGDGDEATITLRPEHGEARRVPLAAIKEARLAFRL
jgi:ribosome maturation factor RimP